MALHGAEHEQQCILACFQAWCLSDGWLADAQCGSFRVAIARQFCALQLRSGHAVAMEAWSCMLSTSYSAHSRTSAETCMLCRLSQTVHPSHTIKRLVQMLGGLSCMPQLSQAW